MLHDDCFLLGGERGKKRKVGNKHIFKTRLKINERRMFFLSLSLWYCLVFAFVFLSMRSCVHLNRLQVEHYFSKNAKCYGWSIFSLSQLIRMLFIDFLFGSIYERITFVILLLLFVCCRNILFHFFCQDIYQFLGPLALGMTTGWGGTWNPSPI